MFNKKKQPPIKSLIAEGSQIDGNINFADGLRIDGAIVGNLYAKTDKASILVISESATVIGEIHADHISINGSVKGLVHARVMLEMHQGAIIAGQLGPLVGVEVEEKPLLKLAANNACLNG